jgi:hypothetical protein
MEFMALISGALLMAMAPMSGAVCEGPGRVREASSAAISQFVRAKRMQVLTFMGYSGAEYESPATMKRAAASILEGKDPATTLVNIGATVEGIGAVYALAKQKGFTTMGIVSSQVQTNQVPLSRCVDHVFVVRDASWGGLLPGTGQLSPTSRAIVENSTEVVAIGGGEVALAELVAARQAGKPVSFIAADMNHAIARQKARKQGKPDPTDFSGPAAGALKFPARP